MKIIHVILFFRNHEDNILVFSFKVVLTLVSSAKLEDKYGYLFHQLADHNACLSEAALSTLLTNFCKVTEMLGENMAYGSHLISSTVASCFRKVFLLSKKPIDIKYQIISMQKKRL